MLFHQDAGQIVGRYAVGTSLHGFLYDGGGYTTVDAPGSAGFNDAHGINLAGQIVGIYSDANGRFHGFLATPVPEPSTLLLAGIGTFSLVGCLWCGRGQPVSWKS